MGPCIAKSPLSQGMLLRVLLSTSTTPTVISQPICLLDMWHRFGILMLCAYPYRQAYQSSVCMVFAGQLLGGAVFQMVDCCRYKRKVLAIFSTGHASRLAVVGEKVSM